MQKTKVIIFDFQNCAPVTWIFFIRECPPTPHPFQPNIYFYVYIFHFRGRYLHRLSCEEKANFSNNGFVSWWLLGSGPIRFLYNNYCVYTYIQLMHTNSSKIMHNNAYDVIYVVKLFNNLLASCIFILMAVI